MDDLKEKMMGLFSDDEDEGEVGDDVIAMASSSDDEGEFDDDIIAMASGGSNELIDDDKYKSVKIISAIVFIIHNPVTYILMGKILSKMTNLNFTAVELMERDWSLFLIHTCLLGLILMILTYTEVI
tara:strand:- start:1159 stop:1539 length:381 start_codon:yes stop_codon:yes gene_type:complete